MFVYCFCGGNFVICYNKKIFNYDKCQRIRMFLKFPYKNFDNLFQFLKYFEETNLNIIFILSSW